MAERRIELKSPADCSKAEMELFYDRTRRGDEVSLVGLRARIKDAKTLAFLAIQGIVVATGAIKRPLPSYRQSTLDKTGIALPEAVFPYELGWIYVLPEYEKQGHGKALVAALLASIKGKGVFATTRTNNEGMNLILPERFEFSAAGDTFLARDRKHYLRLYTRQGEIS